MGEIPYYLQGSPWPYPKASISVLEVLAGTLGIDIDLIPLEEMARKIDESIEQFLGSLYETEAIPPQIRNEIKESIEKMKHVRESPGPITDEDQKRIMEHIDEFFKRGEKGMKELVNVSSQPELENASLIVGWQEDAGKLGPKVIDYLNKHIKARTFCEIEPVKFFPLGGVAIDNDIAQFPVSRFYAGTRKDLVIFESTQPPYERYSF